LERADCALHGEVVRVQLLSSHRVAEEIVGELTEDEQPKEDVAAA